MSQWLADNSSWVIGLSSLLGGAGASHVFIAWFKRRLTTAQTGKTEAESTRIVVTGQMEVVSMSLKQAEQLSERLSQVEKRYDDMEERYDDLRRKNAGNEEELARLKGMVEKLTMENAQLRTELKQYTNGSNT